MQPQGTCSTDGCDRPVYIKRRQLCGPCYQRWWKAQHPDRVELDRQRKRDAYQPITHPPRDCATCGQEFTPKHPHAAYCTPMCRETRMVQCAWCGAGVLKPKSALRYKRNYCDDECKGKHYAQLRPAKPKPAPRAEESRQCACCPAWFTTRRADRLYCDNPTCAVVKSYRLPISYCRRCAECGTGFCTNTRHQRFHDTKCAKRAARRKDKQRHGLRYIGQAARLYVFERDGWVCRKPDGCGRRLNPALIHDNPNHRRAPTIDHITPSSAPFYGSDEPENLQTLCRSCNSRKRNHVGQMRMLA